MSRPGRSRNPRGEGIRLRDEILAAAVGLIDESDEVRPLTLRGVARQAGVSAPSIYAHFADLTSLTDSVLEFSFDQLRSDVLHAIDRSPPDDPAGRLHAAGLAYVQFGWNHRARYRLMFDADGYSTNAIETFTVFADLLAACADPSADSSANSGAERSFDPRLDTWMLWAALHGVATLEKPARTHHRRLGTLDRPAMLAVMIQRLAGLENDRR